MANTDQRSANFPATFIREKGGSLVCTLCAHACRLQGEGERGRCGVRVRQGERLESLVYGRVVAGNVDPIEKKPLFHFLPGSLSYSIATPGCNFTCRHCQNAAISQIGPGTDPSLAGVYRSPAEVVAAARAAGCRSISYTYVEPTVFFEFAYDCALAATAAGLRNVFVSNGFMSRLVIDRLAPLLAAINIDLKSFQDRFYRQLCGGRLAPVLAAIRRFHELGVWVEVTTLIIPGYNDSEEELTAIADFLVEIDRGLVWHVSGYYPAHQLNAPPTGRAILARAREIGLERGLLFVYTGNRPGLIGEDTICPECRRLVVRRQGFQVLANHLRQGHCPDCGARLAGIWE